MKNCYSRHRLAHSRPLDRHKGGGSHYTQIASKYSQIHNNNNNSSSNGANENNKNDKRGKLVSGGQIASVDSGERFLLIRSKMAKVQEVTSVINNRASLTQP